MRLLITGDREWVDYERILLELKRIGCPDKIAILMHGNAAGADKLSEQAALRLGLSKMKIMRFHADWDLYGKPAGPIRNRRMLKHGEPTRVMAFHNHIERSRGTKDMIEIAEKAGIPVWKSWEIEGIGKGD